MVEVNGVYYTAAHIGLFAFLGSALLGIIMIFIVFGIGEYKDSKRKKQEGAEE